MNMIQKNGFGISEDMRTVVVGDCQIEVGRGWMPRVCPIIKWALQQDDDAFTLAEVQAAGFFVNGSTLEGLRRQLNRYTKYSIEDAARNSGFSIIGNKVLFNSTTKKIHGVDWPAITFNPKMVKLLTRTPPIVEKSVILNRTALLEVVDLSGFNVVVCIEATAPTLCAHTKAKEIVEVLGLSERADIRPDRDRAGRITNNYLIVLEDK